MDIINDKKYIPALLDVPIVTLQDAKLDLRNYKESLSRLQSLKLQNCEVKYPPLKSKPLFENLKCLHLLNQNFLNLHQRCPNLEELRSLEDPKEGFSLGLGKQTDEFPIL